MEQEIVKMAASQGLWAALWVALLFYVLRTNEKREAKYQEVIQTLSDKLWVRDCLTG